MPRPFPTTGFEVIESSCLVEEEESEWYKPEEFYPVRIGEVFKSQYQVVGKLGYGTFGTLEALRGEVGALRHLKTIKTDHPGSLLNSAGA